MFSDCQWHYGKSNQCGYYFVCPHLEDKEFICPSMEHARDYEGLLLDSKMSGKYYEVRSREVYDNSAKKLMLLPYIFPKNVGNIQAVEERK